MSNRHESFFIEKFDPDMGLMQGAAPVGRGVVGEKRREFQLVVDRDLATNALDLSVLPFNPEEGGPRWADSEPWAEAELLGSE